MTSLLKHIDTNITGIDPSSFTTQNQGSLPIQFGVHEYKKITHVVTTAGRPSGIAATARATAI